MTYVVIRLTGDTCDFRESHSKRIRLSQCKLKNPIVLNSLKIWFQFRKYFKFLTASPLGPLCNNHLFPPSHMDSAFSTWHNKGICCFLDMYSNGIFSSFANLTSLYGLPANYLFRYFQVRCFVSKCFTAFPSVPLQQPWEGLVTVKTPSRGTISILYNRILDLGNHSN